MEERIKMIKAMEYVARQINDENVFDSWLRIGVEDGAIEYGDLSGEDPKRELEYYCEDDTFAEVMDIFLKVMARAQRSGGLYCDDICSK